MDITRTSTAQESEWRDQGAGVHSSHGVELGLGQRVLRGDLLPPLTVISVSLTVENGMVASGSLLISTPVTSDGYNALR
jgi:hypothetical protein